MSSLHSPNSTTSRTHESSSGRRFREVLLPALDSPTSHTPTASKNSRSYKPDISTLAAAGAQTARTTYSERDITRPLQHSKSAASVTSSIVSNHNNIQSPTSYSNPFFPTPVCDAPIGLFSSRSSTNHLSTSNSHNNASISKELTRLRDSTDKYKNECRHLQMELQRYRGIEEHNAQLQMEVEVIRRNTNSHSDREFDTIYKEKEEYEKENIILHNRIHELNEMKEKHLNIIADKQADWERLEKLKKSNESTIKDLSLCKINWQPAFGC